MALVSPAAFVSAIPASARALVAAGAMQQVSVEDKDSHGSLLSFGRPWLNEGKSDANPLFGAGMLEALRSPPAQNSGAMNPMGQER